MKLRNRLAFSYTAAFISLLGVTFLSIFFIAKNNRQNEFHEIFKERALNSFRLIIEMRLTDSNILEKLDKNLINSMRQNTFLFDSSANLIYSSTNSLKPKYADGILSRLTRNNNEVFLPFGTDELLGLRFVDKGKTYFGVAKADDKIGKDTMKFLAILLLTFFSFSVLIIVLLSVYLSGLITSPIARLTKEIENISPGKLSVRVFEDKGKDEVVFLATKFNEMLDKVENAFKFQYLFINHLSHELKTPLAIMMANAERALAEDEDEKLKRSMQFQKNAIMELSHIINALLDIAKTEKNISIPDSESIRIDELIFECMDEMTFLNTDVHFDFNIDNSLDEKKLTILGNNRMIKMAIMNLIKNAVNFSSVENPIIEITSSIKEIHIKISNDGDLIEPDEQQKLFKHLFRGKNSISVKGFGLGLVLTHRIVSLHKGSLDYSVFERKRNCFLLSLPIAP